MYQVWYKYRVNLQLKKKSAYESKKTTFDKILNVIWKCYNWKFEKSYGIEVLQDFESINKNLIKKIWIESFSKDKLTNNQQIISKKLKNWL